MIRRGRIVFFVLVESIDEGLDESFVDFWTASFVNTTFPPDVLYVLPYL